MAGLFHHISAGVRNFSASLGFYDAVMPTLGISRLFGDEAECFMAYGQEGDFFIISLPLDKSRSAAPCNGTHYCFNAPSKEAVDLFYERALQYGGKDGGPPGVREEYAPDYYAAYVFDPDGHKLEAMYRV